MAGHEVTNKKSNNRNQEYKIQPKIHSLWHESTAHGQANDSQKPGTKARIQGGKVQDVADDYVLPANKLINPKK